MLVNEASSVGGRVHPTVCSTFVLWPLRQTGAAKRWGETLLRRAENKALSRLSYLISAKR
jgi:hypothetical protein